MKVFFLHIPKTGGMFIKYLLSSVKKNIYPIHIADSPKHYVPRDYNDYDMISGHWDFKITKHLTCWYMFTILRNPIERCISHYFYMKNSADKYNCTFNKKIKKYNNPYHFWCDKEVQNYHRNVMVKMLAGQMWSTNNSMSEPKLLEAAIKNAKKLDYIGLYENIDLTINELRNRFSITVPNKLINMTIKDQEICQRTYKVLEGLNNLDLRLYNYFRESHNAKNHKI